MVGSTPTGPTIWGLSSVGRAIALHAIGQRFEPASLHQTMYFVYILQSERTGRFYIGQTQDIEDRVRRHNAGTQAGTKGHLPWRLMRAERFKTREQAYAREREIKAKKNRKWIEWLLEQPVDS